MLISFSEKPMLPEVWTRNSRTKGFKKSSCTVVHELKSQASLFL